MSRPRFLLLKADIIVSIRMLDPLSADAVIAADKVCPNKPVLKFDRTCNKTASRGWHGYQYYGNLDLKCDIRSELRSYAGTHTSRILPVPRDSAPVGTHLRALSAFRNSIGMPPLASASKCKCRPGLAQGWQALPPVGRFPRNGTLDGDTISYCLSRHAMSLGLLSLDGVLSITSFEQFQRHDATPGCHATAIPCYSTAMPGHPQNHYCAREDPPTNASEQSKRPVVVSVLARFSPNGLATPSFSSPVYPVQQTDHGCKGLMVLAAADRKLTQAFLNNPDRCLTQQEAGMLNRQQMRVEILSRPESHQAALARLGQSRNLCQGHGCKGGGLAWAPLL
ncbi:hypothetical protein THAR02_09745 [Trichoderma harzianum]|uniref:Uncharacterized protein n=1 Tax=Trichoderma harzianum TaxID=5544 RepID=A0A0F9WYF7_TRIHA|nr:hypothetical protein THAR02_09745 [Trichoderma harzianum]